MILLNPGPVNLSERVRAALLQPDLCHREAEFADLQDQIRKRLLAIYGLDPERWAAILLSGSGTAAMEAMISSLVPDRGKLLVIENGIYGERLSKIAQIHGIPHTALHHNWGAEIDIPQLEQMLAEETCITHVAAVHHETTTGRLNDLAAIGALCRRYNAQLLADGVSSFGAEALAFEEWGISALAATANKCLHGAPGAAFVIIRRDSLPTPPPCRSLYLNLATYCQEQDRRNTPFTPAIQCFYALSEALHELTDAGGWQARGEHYRHLANLVADGLRQMDIKPLLPRGSSSCVLRSYHLPPNIDYETLHDELKQQGFIIYAGQGGLVAKIFRISTMGAISVQDMQRFLTAVNNILT
ncbi:2-aminoethylphosphonate aminotransferase [Nitrosococcus watsonii]|uniref:2-aminoethylphosphonate--pyruvate transaminase n=1 Tax=Nitrosococcus watsoni (strain C-113) TaxID=105559 RepID=D8K5F2_NITWC|nr:2-aminoethylphosphonate aminotransferase [Nitrosococcus watsonii]ADJ28129.1 2-aminoethylphosphonate aminotransferase [Nitrosococcus watsonii C-113]